MQLRIEKDLTDDVILGVIGKRFLRQRLDRGLTQLQLARESGVSKRTIERLEAGRSVQLSGLIRILRALGLLTNLDALLPIDRPGPMELLERGGKERQRAPKTSQVGEDNWTWGDES